MEGHQTISQSRLRAPLGFQACKIDGAGRLKLPAKYLQYLSELPDKYLFLTEYEGKARIFTNGSWERTIARIADKDLRRRFTFIAESKGSDIDCDPQGRVTLPPVLRKELKLEDTTVQMRFWEDVITIFTQEQYAAELGAALQKKSADQVLLKYMDLGLE